MLSYNDKPIYEASVMTYLDENTAKEVKKQINDTTGKFKDVKTLYDVKLTPRMNFTIKMATLYDGAEGGSYKGPLGDWYSTAVFSTASNTGKHSYTSISGTSYLDLTSSAKSNLKKNTSYYLSMYIKPYNGNLGLEPTIEVKGEKSTIVSKKVKLGSKDYQRVDILVQNSESNPIDKIYIKNASNVHWDDVTFTEISALKPKDLSDDDIKGIYKDYYEDKSNVGMSLDAVTFKNIKPLQNYVTKYRVKNRPAIPGLGVNPIDKTLDSGLVNDNSDVKVNLRDYSSNGINIIFEKVDIYAITKDNREILVYSS
ncbi:hypothetical protein NST86_32105 [Bacillus sp. FSL L8-0199]|uniref:hypothetical protein n=1 Tax=Bacillus sp. FSL L8-0199 TaxID=2954616 RepID=UPI0030F55917